jgi:hypothetical protein
LSSISAALATNGEKIDMAGAATRVDKTLRRLIFMAFPLMFFDVNLCIIQRISA